MATAGPDNLYNLSPDQQDLLLAALTSNSSSSPLFNTPALSNQLSKSISQKSNQMQRPQHTQTSPPAPPHSASLDGSFSNGTPLLGPMEYGEWDPDLDQDGSWDYDFGDDMIHDTPASMSNDGERDTPTPAKSEGEKRKEPPHSDKSLDPHDADPKRRDDKTTTAKKPGRKPLTSEPTSKRKAQNRAAQRAFRERKEKHLKDLEQKVEDLEKQSETANQENSLLRSQIDRLQTELREYKRRLHTSELTRTASLSGLNGFQFDFPPFGTNPFGKDSKGGLLGMHGTNSRDTQRTPSLSSNGNSSGSTKSYPSPASTVHSNYMSGLESTPKHNSGRDSTSSPSASSVSQRGPGSSCGTSPEPCNSSPTISKRNDSLKSISEEKTTITTSPDGEQYICKSGSLDGETESTFCEKLGMACGNPNNPIPKVPQFSTASDTTANSLDWLAQQSSNNTFDPVLFNDYRDPVNDINASIGMSFFDDAFPGINFDTIGSPLGADAPAQQAQQNGKKDLIAEIDAINNNDDDEDEVVPADDPKQMLSCNKICSHPRFVSGELDMDGLCSELRSKAKCSEVGVVVAENDVQEVLGKVGMSHKEFM